MEQHFLGTVPFPVVQSTTS